MFLMASVFSLNANYENDLLLANIKLYYNITRTPTIIIDDTLKKEGLVELDELERIITI